MARHFNGARSNDSSSRRNRRCVEKVVGARSKYVTGKRGDFDTERVGLETTAMMARAAVIESREGRPGGSAGEAAHPEVVRCPEYGILTLHTWSSLTELRSVGIPGLMLRPLSRSFFLSLFLCFRTRSLCSSSSSSALTSMTTHFPCHTFTSRAPTTTRVYSLYLSSLRRENTITAPAAFFKVNCRGG